MDFRYSLTTRIGLFMLGIFDLIGCLAVYVGLAIGVIPLSIGGLLRTFGATVIGMIFLLPLFLMRRRG